MRCRICGNTAVKVFLSLGTTPLANSFLSKEQLSEEEPRFPLELAFCPECKLVQLKHVVPAEEMFREYVYVTSTTQTFKRHFTEMAEHLSKILKLDSKSLAVDIGSNDGCLLLGFQRAGVRTIGVEPAANIAAIAEKNGVETITDFFGEKAVKEILKRKGKADVVTATNVFAHIDDIASVIKNLKLLLKPAGVFVIEVQYLADMLERMTFDNVYHEHLSYFSLTALVDFFRRQGMSVFRAERVDTHGGSLRVFSQLEGAGRKVDSSVRDILDHEARLAISDFATYEAFAKKVYDVRKKLVDLLKQLKAEGKSIAAYGAPAKGNTLLNFCKVGAEHIDYIVDDNPLKQGLYTPGTRIPVVSAEVLGKRKPDYILILAWNFAEEILEKTKKHADAGMKFVVPLPELKVVQKGKDS